MIARPATWRSLSEAGLDPDGIMSSVRAALAEDLRYGPDVTSAATTARAGIRTADVVAREAGVLAGLPVALAVLECSGVPQEAVEPLRSDGSRVRAGEAVLRVRAPLREVLGAERTLLNYLTHACGIATTTRAWVDAVDGTGCVIRDTRKTLPGLRQLQKYAVRCGGGANHRMGLGDAALIKDNHIAAAGGVGPAIAAVRATAPSLPLEVECDTLEQVGEALAAGADLILCDNMTPAQLRAAVRLGGGFPGARFEASGGLRLETARQVAETGVHYLAVGSLTHSSRALDFGLDVR